VLVYCSLPKTWKQQPEHRKKHQKNQGDAEPRHPDQSSYVTEFKSMAIAYPNSIKDVLDLIPVYGFSSSESSVEFSKDKK